MSAAFFRLLGPLDVRLAGRPVPLGGPKPRMLLATLLLQPNVTVSRDHLAEVLWSAEQPRSAAANIRTYVHFLRRRLDGRIERGPSGYVVEAAPEELDATVFERDVAEAQRALAGDDRSRALGLLDRAEGLWRGEPLSDLPHCHTWGPPLARLSELRLSAQELRQEIRIELGEHAEAVAELRGLLATHPLREELWVQLVRALARAGRRAEALSAYAKAEQVLRDELDAEPGSRLREVRARLGEQRPAPAARAKRPPAQEAAPVCQLPLDLPDFTGRDACVNELVGLIRSRKAAGQPTVVAISGPPGVGKSAVAVRVAHAVRAEFPDGQLHADLGGTSASPRRPANVLAELLRSLGVPDAAMPSGTAQRAALLRSRLANARLCVVLDDASDAAQVRPLLPGAGTCALLITSRTRLPDLDGARPVGLDVLPPGEARRLLSGIAGARRVAAEPEAAEAILRSCGRLPLAIRVAGARLAHRPAWTLEMFAGRLADEHRRLDELRAGDLAVRASVTLSYDQLPGSAATAFGGLGVLGPVQFPAWVVAALLARSGADDVVDLLVDTHLVDLVASDATGRPRYRLHDLLRCYAAERAEAVFGHEAVRAAVRRVVRGYLALALAGVERMPVHFFGVLPDAGPAEGGLPVDGETLLADPVAWFEAEHRTGVAMVGLAVRWGLDDLAWRLACALLPYFDLRDHHADWLDTQEIALVAARRANDEHGEATVLRNLGQLHVYQDDYDAAMAEFQRAHELFSRGGAGRDTAVALAGMSTVHRMRGEHERSLDRCHEALELFTANGDRHGEAVVRIAVGTAWLGRGDHATADHWFDEARELSAAIGDRHREAHALHRQAVLHQHRGRLGAARELLDRSIAIFGELGDDHCAGYAQQSLGELYLCSGDLAHAKLLLVNSLSVHRGTGDRRSEAEVSERLGELHEALGQQEASLGYFEGALALWRELDARPQEQALAERVRRHPARHASRA